MKCESCENKSNVLYPVTVKNGYDQVTVWICEECNSKLKKLIESRKREKEREKNRCNKTH